MPLYIGEAYSHHVHIVSMIIYFFFLVAGPSSLKFGPADLFLSSSPPAPARLVRFRLGLMNKSSTAGSKIHLSLVLLLPKFRLLSLCLFTKCAFSLLIMSLTDDGHPRRITSGLSS